MERIGAGIEALVAAVRRRREAAVDRRIGEEATAEREQVVAQLREEDDEREPVVVVPPAAHVPKSERVVKERQRPLFTDMPDSKLPPLALLEEAPPAQEIRQQRDARIHVAADRAQAGRLRRQPPRCWPRIRGR